MFKVSLGAARVNAGLTQKEAALKLGVSNKTLNRWESGENSPPTDKLVAICELYQVPFDNLKILYPNPL